jgi:hypothetical protein
VTRSLGISRYIAGRGAGLCHEVDQMMFFDGGKEALLGFGGGVLAETLQWFNLRYTFYRGLPDWSKSWLYWVVTLAMSCAGGGYIFCRVHK